MTMRKTVAAVALGVGWLALAPIAHADTGAFSGTQGDHDAHAYWVDARGAGLSGTLADAARLANVICMRLGNGESESQLIAGGAGGKQSIDTATFLIHAAEWHFCPNN